MAPDGKERGRYKRYQSDPTTQNVPRRTKYRKSVNSMKGPRIKRPGALLCQKRRELESQIQEQQHGSGDQRFDVNAQLIQHHSEIISDENDCPTETQQSRNDTNDEEMTSISSESMENSRSSDTWSEIEGSPNRHSPERNANERDDSIHDEDLSQDRSEQNFPRQSHMEDFPPPDAENTDDLPGYSQKKLIRVLMILVTKMRHNGTYSLAENISEAIEALSDSPEAPLTKYKLQKVTETLSTFLSIHHFCNSCSKYAGQQEKITQEEEIPTGILMCINCENEINMKENWEAGNVFIHLSLAAQLSEFFSRHGDSILYSQTRRKESKFAVEDIFDGKIYKQKVTQDMISVNFSVDGVPIFRSSGYSMHPVLCTINELAPEKRPVTMFLCDLYCGTGKVPDINGYLSPLVAECNELREHGFCYTYQGKFYRKKCQLLLGICDSIARPEVRNCTQFNGEYGCGFCKHPGVRVPKGLGYVNVYPIDEHGNAFGEGLRTHEETLIYANTLEKGIRGRSVLCDVVNFDIIRNLPVEWMHNTGLGVVKQFANLWFLSVNHSEPFYCGRSLPLVDEILLSFKPSLEVSRTPRKMSDRSHWKAHEWMIFLLFYSIPTMKSVLPSKYVQHWALLVDAISILTRSSIMPADIFYAQQCLFQFVKGVETLYGREHLSYNVHLLTHLAQSVLDCGPLWTHSAFGYENYYQTLLQFVHSSNKPSLQIFHSFRLQMVVHKLYDLCVDSLTQRQKRYVHKLLFKKTYPKVTWVLGQVSLLGKPKIATLQRRDYLALQRINVRVDSNKIVSYVNRMILNREIFHSTEYSRPSKRRSYFVLLKNSTIFEINRFVVFTEADKTQCYAIGYYFQKDDRPLVYDRRLTHITVLRNKIDHLAAVSVDFIQEKVIFIEMPQCQLMIACKHPNHCELMT